MPIAQKVSPAASTGNQDITNQIPVRPILRNGTLPILDTIEPLPADRKPTHSRDSVMVPAFGLENDIGHWERMKALGILFCQNELPPHRLDQEVIDNRSLTPTQVKALQFNGSRLDVRKWMWSYGLRDWKTQFEYDIRYLNRRYPECDVSDIILRLISEWNGLATFTARSRQWSNGRDFREVMNDIASGKSPQVPHVTPGLIGKGCRIDAAISTALPREEADQPNILVDSLSQVSSHREECAPSDLRDEVNTVDWKRVIIRFYHQSELEVVPVDKFSMQYLCGVKSCSLFNIQTNTLKQDLQKKFINWKAWSLKVLGTKEVEGWELRDICMLGTYWQRIRGANKHDLSLILVDQSSETLLPVRSRAYLPGNAIDDGDNTTTDQKPDLNQLDASLTNTSPEPTRIAFPTSPEIQFVAERSLNNKRKRHDTSNMKQGSVKQPVRKSRRVKKG